MSKYSLEDEALMVEALSGFNARYVWLEFVESRSNYEIRSYWRSLFFKIMNDFCPVELKGNKYSLPRGENFVNMIDVWLKNKGGLI